MNKTPEQLVEEMMKAAQEDAVKLRLNERDESARRNEEMVACGCHCHKSIGVLHMRPCCNNSGRQISRGFFSKIVK